MAHSGILHLIWRGLSRGSLDGKRVLYAWPDRKHLNDLWGVEADALVVIEWGESETAEWIEDAHPVQLLPGHTAQPPLAGDGRQARDPLPNGVEEIIEYIAEMAAGYSSGLKWNEEDKLRADMMNRPGRWASITVEQLRAKCRESGMRPNDTDTVAGFLQS